MNHTTTPLAPDVLDLTIANDEWRRSRTRPERIWTNGPLEVVLTTDRKVEVQLGLLTLHSVQVPQREAYLEAKAAAIAVAQALVERVAERAELIKNFRYPGETEEEVIAQARLFLLDWTTEIHELYERFAPLEMAMGHGHERDVLVNISQALANSVF